MKGQLFERAQIDAISWIDEEERKDGEEEEEEEEEEEDNPCAMSCLSQMLKTNRGTFGTNLLPAINYELEDGFAELVERGWLSPFATGNDNHVYFILSAAGSGGFLHADPAMQAEVAFHGSSF